jgi:hypothetical protein
MPAKVNCPTPTVKPGTAAPGWRISGADSTRRRVPHDDKIESLARENGVSAMVKPREQGPSASAPVDMPAEDSATPRNRMKAVNLKLPDYVWTELRYGRDATDEREVSCDVGIQRDGITSTKWTWLRTAGGSEENPCDFFHITPNHSSNPKERTGN